MKRAMTGGTVAIALLTSVSLVSVGGCSSKTARYATTGGAIGAAGGAVVGAASGGSVVGGAVIGGAAGAATGAVLAQ
ncbi:hypothetical protein ACUN0C_02115 [Faunimonas sp. B44]|uniref:hypothetical protein n=1 Tax=Faunimonas sp. B44 TaxID=3461493 RepID=UPI004043A654